MSEGSKRDEAGPAAPLEVTAASDRTAKAAPGADGLRPGDTLAGRYVLTRYVATGGMGQVWEARDERLGEVVALKTVRPDRADAQVLKRFEQEVKLARRVSHPNVCRVFDVGLHTTADGTGITFLTMELLKGKTLAEALARRGPLKPDEALGLLKQVAQGLDAAHATGVVHRDLKPSNIFLEEGGEGRPGGRVVITDFGIARSLREDVRITATDAGLVGTPAYMAPEQVEGRAAGPAADVYALGVVTFELLTGAFPFAGDTPIENALARLSTAPRSLASMGVTAPSSWQVALSRALARNPAERFGTASEYVAALGGQAQPHAASGRLTSARGVALALLLVVVVGVVGAAWHRNSSPQPFRWADLSTASTTNPQAAAKFREAIRLHKDRSGDDPLVPLREAVALDPGFAEAWLQLAYLELLHNTLRTPKRGEASPIRKAERLRHLLSPRDGAFLLALKPLYDVNRSVVEAVSRLRALVGERPRDAPAWEALGSVEVGFRLDTDAAVAAFRRSRELDSSNVGVVTEAIQMLERGEAASAVASLKTCASALNAVCHTWLVTAHNIAGDCVAMERAARDADYPGNFDAFSSLQDILNAQAGQGRRPLELLAFARRYRQMYKQREHNTNQEEETLLRYLERHHAVDFLDELESVRELGMSTLEVEFLLEIGDEAGAVASARGKLQAEEARSSVVDGEGGLFDTVDPGVLLAAQTGPGGGLTVAEYRRARSKWLERALREGGKPAWWNILALYSVPPSVEPLEAEDARTALAALASEGGVPDSQKLLVHDTFDDTRLLFTLGKLQLGAGQLEAAHQTFRKVLGPCQNRVDGWYRYFLGVTQEQLGDREGACASYAAVVERWGEAKPRSVTAERARARAAKLSCPNAPPPSSAVGAMDAQ